MTNRAATPTLDLAQARAFLARLDPEADGFTLQTFDDTPAKRTKAARVHHIALGNEALDELARWNVRGAGVFVTVNETDGAGRQTHNIKRVRAVFVDLDGAPLAPILAAGLEPHIVCESSPGRYHAYWLTDDCPLDQFERVQHALARRFNGDPSVHDLPRVMRLPGFLHNKGEPFVTRELDGVGFNGPPYALAEIVAALKLELDAPNTKPEARPDGNCGTILPGERHAHLFALGRSMARRSTPQAVRAALAAENAARCSPPLADADLDYLAARAFTAKHALVWQDQIQSDADDANAPTGQSATLSATALDSDDWPEPQPLAAKVAAEPYPLDALPATIRAAVTEVSAFVKAPAPLVLSSAFAALSLAGQAHIDVRRAERLRGPCGLFLLTIADSGERKSTCDGFFLSAIRDFEAEQSELTKPEVKRHEAVFAAWAAQREGILQAIKQGGKTGKPVDRLRGELAVLENEKPEPPRIPRLLYADATPEALAWSLAHGWPSGGVVSSEAGLVFGAHAMGRDSIMRNLAMLNQLWDGNALHVDRRTTESFVVRGARLTVALQVQEPTLRSFFDRSGGLARGSGFLARFLTSWPESTQGNRPFTEAPPSWPHLAAFHRRIAAILANPAPINEAGALTPPALTLAPEAKAAWVMFHDAIESELASGGELFDVRDVASKTADNAVRLAALFQIFEYGMGGAVGLECFEAASRIAAWHLNEARRFFGELALPAELANAARLDDWLIAYCRRERTHLVPIAKLQQGGPGGLRSKATIEAAMRELDEADRARLRHDGRRKWIAVNPALLDGGEA